MKFTQSKNGNFGNVRIIFIFLICEALSISIMPIITPTVESDGSRADTSLYHTYEEMVAEIQGIEANHPSIVWVNNLTTTYEGRTVWAVKISDNPQSDESNEEPGVLFMAGEKANSLISVEIALHLINHLTDNYGEDDKITDLIKNREVWIIPMVNPDGHEYIDNGTEGWEKNRRKTGDDTFGVNLNRNYEFEWGVDDYSSEVKTSQYYHGEKAFSEPETRAVRDLVKSQNFVFSLSLSSYGETITYPWGYTTNPSSHDNLLSEIANDMAMYSGYNVKQSSELYIHHGNADDWLYNASVLPFTIFAGTENIPKENQIDPIANENIPACIYLLDIADNPNRALKAEWTFMVYMGGDGAHDLEKEGILDINEMEMVGSNPYINIIVQFDRATAGIGTKRYMVMKDYDDDVIHSPEIRDIGEVNMANPQTLLEFVNWSITNYPAEHYFLDIWGHGKGWLGVTLDDGDWIEMDEIKSILPAFKDRIDVVGFDNCNMAMIEVYTQFLGYTDYIVGSQKEEDAYGWPYDRIFEDLSAAPQTSPLDLSTIIATHYVEWARNNSLYSATASVVDMSNLPQLINETDVLAEELDRMMALYTDEIDEVIDYPVPMAERYDREPYPRDLYHFAELIERYVPNQPIKIVARNVMEGVENFVLFEDHNSNQADTKVPIVDNAHGISVWLYDGTISDFQIYKGLDFADFTHWDEFLAAYKDPPPKPQVAFQVDYTLSDFDKDDNNDTINLAYNTEVIGLNISVGVFNGENEHIITFYNDTTIEDTFDFSFNPNDYGHPSDYYNFYAYLTNDTNAIQNYTEVTEIWLGNERPEIILEDLAFFRKDGTRVGGNTSKKPIDGENTLIKVNVTNTGTISLPQVKIDFFEGKNLIKTDVLNLVLGEKKNVSTRWLASIGERNIRVVVDGENLIKETDESNNELTEEINVKSNIPENELKIYGKVKNKENVIIIGADVQIRNMRTNATINKTTNENGYEVKLKPEWYLEGDRIDVKAEYNSVTNNESVYAYSDAKDEEITVDIILDTEVYDALFFFKMGLIVFEIVGFILVIKYYIGMKRKKDKE